MNQFSHTIIIFIIIIVKEFIVRLLQCGHDIVNKAKISSE